MPNYSHHRTTAATVMRPRASDPKDVGIPKSRM
jgi:hypothetical protein